MNIYADTNYISFRACDILHVTLALLLGCLEFWSFNKKGCKLAKLEGLKTV